METGWRSVGMLFASRPNGSELLTPSMRITLKREFWPPAEIEPSALLTCEMRGSRRM